MRRGLRLLWMVVIGAAVFAAAWWIGQDRYDLDVATAVAVATFVATAVSAPLAILWSGSDRPASPQMPVSGQHEPARPALSQRLPRQPRHVGPSVSITAADGGAAIGATGSGAVAAGSIGTLITGGNGQVFIGADNMLKPAQTVPMEASLNNLPKVPTRVFVGREEELAALEQTMREGLGVVSQTVQGLGGVGKSELALHYAYLHRDRYQLVWWVTADSQSQVEAGLASLTHRLQPNAQVATAEESAKWARSWLQSHNDWLLILDNVDDRGDVEELLAQLTNGHVLITTRRQVGWEQLVDGCVQLDVLERDAAALLLMERSGQTDRAAATQLAAELGYLPLALQQVAAYLAQTKVDMTVYLRGWHNGEQTPSDTAAGDDAERAVARVWQISLASIDCANPLASKLLGLLACFGPDNLPRDVLAGYDIRADVDGALGLLQSYSMISLTRMSVSVHRLVQAVVRKQSEASDLRLTAVLLLQSSLPEGNPQHAVAGWPRWLELIPHVHAVSGLFTRGSGDLELARLLSEAAVFLTAQGAYADALAYKQRALAINEGLLGPEHLTVASGLDSIGNSMRDLGRADEAVPLQQRALAITEQALGAESLEVAVRLNNLAGSLRDLGRATEAVLLQRRALAITEQELGAENLEVAVRLNNLAGSLQALGLTLEALPLQQRALAITETIHDPDHPDVATRLNNLAVSLKTLGRTGEAIPLQERALAITEKARGPNHPKVAVAMNNLALSLLSEGRSREAAPLQERALTIALKALGPDHPITRTVRMNQGSLRHHHD